MQILLHRVPVNKFESRSIFGEVTTNKKLVVLLFLTHSHSVAYCTMCAGDTMAQQGSEGRGLRVS